MKNFSAKTLKGKLEAKEKELTECKEANTALRRRSAVLARGLERLIAATSPDYAKQFFKEHYEIASKRK